MNMLDSESEYHEDLIKLEFDSDCLYKESSFL